MSGDSQKPSYAGLQARLDLIIFNQGYHKAQLNQILMRDSAKATAPITRTGILSDLKEAYEAGEILMSIGRGILGMLGRHWAKIPALAVGAREFLRWLGLG